MKQKKQKRTESGRKKGVKVEKIGGGMINESSDPALGSRLGEYVSTKLGLLI